MTLVTSTTNRSFEKALLLLAHPASLAALCLMLFNDQVLRRLSPSWWTGKLSDLAWLFLVPYVAAVVIAWLVPGRKVPARHEGWTAALAYGLTGLGFVLIKTIPAANSLATRIFTTLTGSSPALLLDPSDLLALPALAGSAWLWHSMKETAVPQPFYIIRRLVILPAAALVLMADAAAPDLGITCFSPQENRIYAQGGYGSSYVSQDGGITWEPAQPGTEVNCTRSTSATGAWQEATGPRPGTLYRYQPNMEIQLSTDAGKTWQTAYKQAEMSEPERYYYLKSRQGSPMINPGPNDAVADPVSGNMLFAMGQQGVLVHTANNEWVWSQGGAYQRPEAFPSGDAIAMLLGGMIFLAAGSALVIYCTLALRWAVHWVRITVLVLAWLAWLALVVMFPPATTYSYASTISAMGILVLTVLILPLAIEQTVRVVQRGPRDLPRLLGFALAGGLLFMVPYVLWVYSILPAFEAATITALILTAAVLASGWVISRTARLAAGKAS